MLSTSSVVHFLLTAASSRGLGARAAHLTLKIKSEGTALCEGLKFRTAPCRTCKVGLILSIFACSNYTVQTKNWSNSVVNRLSSCHVITPRRRDNHAEKKMQSSTPQTQQSPTTWWLERIGRLLQVRNLEAQRLESADANSHSESENRFKFHMRTEGKSIHRWTAMAECAKPDANLANTWLADGPKLYIKKLRSFLVACTRSEPSKSCRRCSEGGSTVWRQLLFYDHDQLQ